MQKENTMTVGRWCGRWFIANRHKWDGNTEGGYRNLIYSHILPSIGSTVSEAVSAPHTKASLITYENNKLRTRYAEYLKARELPPSGSDISITDTIAEITTDDERIVLLLGRRIRIAEVCEVGHSSGKQVLLETLLNGRIRRNRTVQLHELPK